MLLDEQNNNKTVAKRINQKSILEFKLEPKWCLKHISTNSNLNYSNSKFQFTNGNFIKFVTHCNWNHSKTSSMLKDTRNIRLKLFLFLKQK